MQDPSGKEGSFEDKEYKYYIESVSLTFIHTLTWTYIRYEYVFVFFGSKLRWLTNCDL